MRSFKLFATFVCAHLACDLALSAAEYGSPTWRHDFQAAEAEAKQLNRPLLVHFHAKWCGPCQNMNREVLSDPSVLRHLGATVVPVKIDSDEHRDLANRLHVETLPTDIFLDPSGTVLARHSGYQDRQQYLSLVARVEARFEQSHKLHIALKTTPVNREPASLTRTTPPPIAPNPVQRPYSTSPLIARNTNPLQTHGPQLTSTRRPQVSVGLRGFSPVALVTIHEWVRGNDRFACEYKGVIYYLASSAEVEQFKLGPDRYAPQVLGCDPVILDITDRAVPGDIHYAAFFESELYLFVSEKSRQIFRQDPERFVRTKHVLKVDESDDQRLE